jgi:hypothetical protein
VESLRLLLRADQPPRPYWGPVARPALTLSLADRQQLLSATGDDESRRARRARVILALAGGETMTAVARRFGVSKRSLRQWVKYFERAGVNGLDMGSNGFQGEPTSVRRARVWPERGEEGGAVRSLRS